MKVISSLYFLFHQFKCEESPSRLPIGSCTLCIQIIFPCAWSCASQKQFFLNGLSMWRHLDTYCEWVIQLVHKWNSFKSEKAKITRFYYSLSIYIYVYFFPPVSTYISLYMYQLIIHTYIKLYWRKWSHVSKTVSTTYILPLKTVWQQHAQGKIGFERTHTKLFSSLPLNFQEFTCEPN